MVGVLLLVGWFVASGLLVVVGWFVASGSLIGGGGGSLGWV